MNDGSVIARHFSTGERVEVCWKNGRIASVQRCVAAAGEDVWIAPPLLDLQVNGFAGVDFQQDDLTVEDLLRAARGLRAACCTRFFLTLVTDAWPRLMTRLRHLRALRESSEELRQAIAGWHVEGPFLSAEPGFCGAHDPRLMIDPTLDHLRELRDAAGPERLLLTLAPERPGSKEMIEQAVLLGIRVSLGHTNASAETLRRALEAGAGGFTHLGNACPQMLDRHDNILWRMLDARGLLVSLIPDRIHVSPPLFRLVHRVLGQESIYYTTDAMAAAGALPGCYKLGRTKLEVGADQIVRLPGKTNFAGSALRPIDGVWRAAEMLGVTWREVWDGFSTRPARWMDLEERLGPGREATFCLIQGRGEDTTPSVRMVWRGEEQNLNAAVST